MQLDLYLGLAALASKLHPALHPVASSRSGGGRALWADCPPAWLKRIGGVLQPNEIGLRLSERRSTNIGLLYPKVRNNIGGIFPLTSPPNQNIGDVSPSSPAGLTPVITPQLAF